MDFAAAEEGYLQEVANSNNVADSNQQASISPSTSCQPLVFTLTPSQILSVSTKVQDSSIEERST
jgi:hypothetical protein